MSTRFKRGVPLGLILIAVCLALSHGTISLDGAPAPVYRERPPSLETAHRALPKALREEIERFQNSIPEIIEGAKQSSKLARTQKEKDAYLAGVENWKRHYYSFPIQHLEYQRQQPDYVSREDQQKIEEALKFYRIQYAEAKKKGLFKIANLKE